MLQDKGRLESRRGQIYTFSKHAVKILFKPLQIGIHGIGEVIHRLVGEKETAYRPRTLSYHRQTRFFCCGSKPFLQPSTHHLKLLMDFTRF